MAEVRARDCAPAPAEPRADAVAGLLGAGEARQEGELGRFLLHPVTGDVLSLGSLTRSAMLAEGTLHAREVGTEASLLHLRRVGRRRWRMTYANNATLELDADRDAGRIYVLYKDRLETIGNNSLRLYAQLK